MLIRTLGSEIKNLITKLAFTSARFLDESSIENTILEIKNNKSRDVVTELDHILNKEIKDIINSQFPRALIISEEDKVNNKLDYFNSLTFLIDPLDGSQNFSLGLPFYSSLITVIKEKKIIASSNVTHFNHQIITWEKDSGLYSNVELGNISQNGPSYFAYSPINNFESDQITLDILVNIDTYSSGLYRWGSASNGLIELLNGRLQSFIGFKIRLWDCLGFLPILIDQNIYTAFIVDGLKISLIASRDFDQFNDLKNIFSKNKIILKDYHSSSEKI
ncbi:MAG: hypothetical protein CL851_01215 [Crocinitomicaceae bacterium]|nr:hypothetical protein [Crocinitomicaceae bacterium]|tara:strand:- start:3985 stop:4812 length:828 start_codon:yes stop_codon:yes gene_type:complete